MEFLFFFGAALGICTDLLYFWYGLSPYFLLFSVSFDKFLSSSSEAVCVYTATLLQHLHHSSDYGVEFGVLWSLCGFECAWRALASLSLCVHAWKRSVLLTCWPLVKLLLVRVEFYWYCTGNTLNTNWKMISLTWYVLFYHMVTA